MHIKNVIRKLLESLTRSHIFRQLPRGISVFNDIKGALPNYHFATIFDVGANVGQSALEYIRQYPSSRIYCFEPITATFQELRKNTGFISQIHCFQLALGSTSGEAKMLCQGTATTNHVLAAAEMSLNDKETAPERVNILTLDEFCGTRGIDQISYLKIDTEGGDLEVLKGTENMLLKQCIDFIEVEAGMTSHNKYHVPFELITNHLAPLNYHLFGVYEQVSEWLNKEPQLRRANLVFISQTMIDAYKG